MASAESRNLMIGVDVEQEPLVEPQMESKSRFSGRKRVFAIAVPLVVSAALVIAAFVHRPGPANSHNAEQVDLASASFCGALTGSLGITKDVNDFSTMEAMEQNGWHFDHRGACRVGGYHFKADRHAPKGHQMHIKKNSYYGWCWTGEEIMTLTMKGCGHLALVVGNANEGKDDDVGTAGVVLVTLGSRQYTVLPGEMKTLVIPFTEGQLLKIEEQGDAIIVIEDLSFRCGTAPVPGAPAQAPAMGRPDVWGKDTFIDDMEFKHMGNDDWDCDACVYESEGDNEVAWDKSTMALAINDRTWCATSCSFLGHACVGILFPLREKNRCKILTSTCDKSACDFAKSSEDRSKWDYLKLVKKNPPLNSIPSLERKSE
eukprot:TRINITY_DN46387_c0_g1_i1.p1 TRINITY_DN46387_c0_g1~~TRINITY_DN46387_c0_g1_i1.p1  ORF type:complete len:398 (-),score=72.99 TRINITY_DN46387_c0_g1_i1:114-1232(-)